MSTCQGIYVTLIEVTDTPINTTVIESEEIIFEALNYGIDGASGWSGFSGWSGYSGWSGKSGYSGFTGTSGISGYSGYGSDYISNITPISTTYNVLLTDKLIVATAGTFDVDLPAATGSGRVLRIKNIGTGVVTVDPNGAETIDGEASQTLNQWEGIVIVDNDTGTWIVI